MANARMYLRCNACKKAIMLSRHYGQPWSLDRDVDEIDSFFRRHFKCGDNNRNMHRQDFSLIYEGNGDEYTIEYSMFEDLPDYVREEIDEWKKENE